MNWFSTLASCGIAIGSPLIYLDQYFSIKKTQSSEGFSHVICLVLLTANVTRLFYWLGERFDTALLIQSILMIIAQLTLLKMCMKYSNNSIQQQNDSLEELDDDLEALTNSNLSTALTLSSNNSPQQPLDHLNHPLSTTTRPSSLIHSRTFDDYIDTFALLFAVEAGLFILLQRYDWFIQAIGFFSLGLESTLPIPQLFTNHRRKSLAGLSPMVMIGWLFGDSFKSVYLVFLTPESNSVQFKICALFQLSIDILILGQAILFRRQTRLDLISRNRSHSRSSTISENNNSAQQNLEHLPVSDFRHHSTSLIADQRV